MRLLNYKRRLLLLPILMLGLLFTMSGNLMAQSNFQGTSGYEESSVTVSYADIVAYDAAHPYLEFKNPLNPKKHKNVPESEFRHGDLQPKANYSAPTNSAKTLADRMKQITITSPAPTANFLGCADDGSAIPPDTYGAVGPNHILITLNTQVRILNKTEYSRLHQYLLPVFGHH